MIPHATHGFDGSGLPENVPYFLTLSGYMLIFFVEKVAFDAHHIMQDEGDGDALAHGGSSVSVPLKGGDEVAAASAAPVAPPSGRSAVILLLALGVHALMETMALGLSSNKLSAGLLAMSIGLHQVRLLLVPEVFVIAGSRVLLRRVPRVVLICGGHFMLCARCDAIYRSTCVIFFLSSVAWLSFVVLLRRQPPPPTPCLTLIAISVTDW